MGEPVTPERFTALMDGWEHSWFKWEAQPTYRNPAETLLLQRLHEAGEVRPEEFAWWKQWLDFAEARDRAGKTMQRVRVYDEPLTPYQRDLRRLGHWHANAGDHILYIPRSRADRVGLIQPGNPDWHMFDSSQVVVTRFTPEGEIAGKELIIDETELRRYRRLRNLALQHASAAEDAPAQAA